MGMLPASPRFRPGGLVGGRPRGGDFRFQLDAPVEDARRGLANANAGAAVAAGFTRALGATEFLEGSPQMPGRRLGVTDSIDALI